MAPTKTIQEQYYGFAKTLHAANLALCVKENIEHKNSLVKNFAFGMTAAYFWLNSEKAFKGCELFFANPTEKIVFEVKNKTIMGVFIFSNSFGTSMIPCRQPEGS